MLKVSIVTETNQIRVILMILMGVNVVNMFIMSIL